MNYYLSHDIVSDYSFEIEMATIKINYFIKTECGRAKYAELSKRKGLPAQIRLIWFIIFAAINDWNIQNSENHN